MIGLSAPVRAPAATAYRPVDAPRANVPFRVSFPAAAPSCPARSAHHALDDVTATCSRCVSSCRASHKGPSLKCCEILKAHLCPVYRSPLACEAAATAQLATYAFPPQAPPVFHWFESCVKEIVKNLDKAPFLQLVFPDRKASFERHQVNASVIAVPQVGFGQHLYSSHKAVQMLQAASHAQAQRTDVCSGC